MLGGLTSSDKGLLLQVKGYSDASLADNLDTRRSTAGHVVMVAGGAVARSMAIEEAASCCTQLYRGRVYQPYANRSLYDLGD
ncbi:hypothetical protein E4U56_006147 [Claviceps arundinis]|uniref:Uncharacterized protein n=1 Tax=Claviceps arundinis TaxID=1623583 RepID=A0A9P7SS18_9HYPO|nr:hypothetical protein E4U56_006147 [Claviceps arundinis]